MACAIGTWFKSGAIDVEVEREAALARDSDACDMLFSRLADVALAPDATLKEDAVVAAPHLGYWRSKNEAMVYRLIGSPKKPQVLIFGHVKGALDMGALVSKALERDRLS